MCVCETRGQLAGVGFLLLLCEFRIWSSGHQAWWQSSLFPETSHQYRTCLLLLEWVRDQQVSEPSCLHLWNRGERRDQKSLQMCWGDVCVLSSFLSTHWWELIQSLIKGLSRWQCPGTCIPGAQPSYPKMKGFQGGWGLHSVLCWEQLCVCWEVMCVGKLKLGSWSEESGLTAGSPWELVLSLLLLMSICCTN